MDAANEPRDLLHRDLVKPDRTAALVVVILTFVVSGLLLATPPAPPRSGGPAGEAMDIDRSLSDGAQLNTIAFDALAFMTGDLGSYTFFPPGKVCDLFGFQYLRDNDSDSRGHSGEFLSVGADNVLYVLRPAQRAELLALAEEQADSIDQFAYGRMEVIAAFTRLLEGDLPEGCTGLDESEVDSAFEQLYLLDGRMCVRRAEVMGSVISSLDASQRAYLDEMASEGMESWPDVRQQIDQRSLPRNQHVALMTYASDLFSWYAGSEEADVYFCPERHGTYFGSFCMKDLQAMADPEFNIGENVTADLGQEFLGALAPAQRILIESLVARQKSTLLEIVEIRRALSRELRQAMDGGSVDEAEVLRLAAEYGRLDADISLMYVEAFAQVYSSLTGSQRDQLDELREEAGSGPSSGAYLYSEPIAMPDLPNTDRLFH